jgi:hypothetical protein
MMPHSGLATGGWSSLDHPRLFIGIAMLRRVEAVESRETGPGINDPSSADWIMPHADLAAAEKFGLRLRGGGTHQAKTMMLHEISIFLDSFADSAEARSLIIDANVLNKRTASTRLVTFRHLNALYGIGKMPVITKALASLWQRDRQGQPLLALLCALARDPLLRDTAKPVLDTPVGIPVRWPALASVFEQKHPGRFSPKMLKSLAQNCASTWTQSGHLRGAVRKRRIRAEPTPYAAAYAALIATACGFGGPALLDSSWLQVLDVEGDRALELLRQAEGHGLARVRSAGDVIEVSVRQSMATTLRVPELAHLR